MHPAVLTTKRRQSGFPAYCLEAWRNFVDKNGAGAGLCILEGSLFQSTVRFMLEEEQQHRIEGYIEDFEQIVRPLSPVVIYLRPVDAMEHSRGVVRPRGEAWTAKVSEYLETTRYSLGRMLTGSEGMHRLWSDYAELCDSLVARMTTAKLTVSGTPPDMELSFARAINFLSSTGHVRAATNAL